MSFVFSTCETTTAHLSSTHWDVRSHEPTTTTKNCMRFVPPCCSILQKLWAKGFTIIKPHADGQEQSKNYIRKCIIRRARKIAVVQLHFSTNKRSSCYWVFRLALLSFPTFCLREGLFFRWIIYIYIYMLLHHPNDGALLLLRVDDNDDVLLPLMVMAVVLMMMMMMMQEMKFKHWFRTRIAKPRQMQCKLFFMLKLYSNLKKNYEKIPYTNYNLKINISSFPIAFISGFIDLSVISRWPRKTRSHSHTDRFWQTQEHDEHLQHSCNTHSALFSYTFCVYHFIYIYTCGCSNLLHIQEKFGANGRTKRQRRRSSSVDEFIFFNNSRLNAASRSLSAMNSHVYIYIRWPYGLQFGVFHLQFVLLMGVRPFCGRMCVCVSFCNAK